MGPLIPLFWTSGDVSSGFKARVGSLIRAWRRRVRVMFSQVSVCTQGMGGCLWSHVLSVEGGYLWYQVQYGGVGMSRGVGMAGGWVCLLVGMSRGRYSPLGSGISRWVCGYSSP